MAEPEPSTAEPEPNPYELRGVSDRCIEIRANHPIQFITRNWQDNDLTQGQWDEVYPRIARMLGDCVWYEEYGVGPGDRNTTCAEAVSSLDHEFDTSGMTDDELADDNQPEETVKHIELLYVIKFCPKFLKSKTRNEKLQLLPQRLSSRTLVRKRPI